MKNRAGCIGWVKAEVRQYCGVDAEQNCRFEQNQMR